MADRPEDEHPKDSERDSLYCTQGASRYGAPKNSAAQRQMMVLSNVQFASSITDSMPNVSYEPSMYNGGGDPRNPEMLLSNIALEVSLNNPTLPPASVRREQSGVSDDVRFSSSPPMEHVSPVNQTKSPEANGVSAVPPIPEEGDHESLTTVKDEAAESPAEKPVAFTGQPPALKRKQSAVIEIKLNSGHSKSFVIEPPHEIRTNPNLAKLLDAAQQSALRLLINGGIPFNNTTPAVTESMRNLHQSSNRLPTAAPLVDDDDEADECPICMDILDGDDELKTSCQHTYHYSCLLRFMRYKNCYNCPYCTQTIEHVTPRDGNPITQEQLKTMFYASASDIVFREGFFFKPKTKIAYVPPSLLQPAGGNTKSYDVPEIQLQLVDSQGRPSKFEETFKVNLIASVSRDDVSLTGSVEAPVEADGSFQFKSLRITLAVKDGKVDLTSLPIKFEVKCLTNPEELELLCDGSIRTGMIRFASAPVPKKISARAVPKAKPKKRDSGCGCDCCVS